MREVGQGGLQQENGAEDVDGVHFGELFGSDVAEGFVACDAGIIDDDVNLEGTGFGVREVVFSCVDEIGRTGGRADVGLDGERTDIVLGFKLRDKFGGGLGGGVGGVV